MRALIWKEYRERRMWVLILTLSIVLTMIRGGGYTFVSAGGFREFVTTGIMPDTALYSMLIALFFGAGAFSSEIDRSARFLFSHPVTWRRLLAAKLTVGLAALLATAILSALVFLSIRPPQYLAFATPGRLAVGVLWAFFLLAVPFLIGFVCSAVFPGAAGGILVLVLIWVLTNLVYVAHRGSGAAFRPSMLVWLIGGPVAAMITTVRAGLYKPVQQRMTIYGLAMLGAVAVSLLTGLLKANPDEAIANAFYRVTRLDASPGYERMSIGPGGRQAIVDQTWFYSTNRRRAKLPIEYTGDALAVQWVSKNTAVLTMLDGLTPDILLVSPGTRGSLATSRISTGRLTPPFVLIPSPGARRVAVVQARYDEGRNGWNSAVKPGQRCVANDAQMGVELAGGPVGILDCSNSRTFRSVPAVPTAVWWQSDDVIGYNDELGRVRTIPASR